MKVLKECLSLLAFLVLIGACFKCSDKSDLEYQIREAEPFMLQGKEWHCALTTRQVDIDILEEKIKELKK